MDPNNVEDNLYEAWEHRNLLLRRELIFDLSVDHVGSFDVGDGLGVALDAAVVYHGGAELLVLGVHQPA